MVKVSMGQKVVAGALVVMLGWWGWLAISAGSPVEVLALERSPQVVDLAYTYELRTQGSEWARIEVACQKETALIKWYV